MKASNINEKEPAGVQVESTPEATEKTSKKVRRISKTKQLAEEVERLKVELAECKDKYLRMAAEFENFKKRHNKEISEIFDRAIEQFSRELLPIIDDFERSLNSKPKRKSYQSLRQGIELIYQKLIAMLKKQGLEPISSLGQQFNPELHEAIMQVEDDAHPPNSVVSEILKGYRLKDRVLRHAQVIVAK